MPNPAWLDSPLMKAARREPTPHTPVWLMRQAGRYLPEYRKLRERTPFLDLCKNPDLCAEIAVSTAERLGVDAAILFSDLLVIVEPMGLRLAYSAGEGPTLDNPIRTAADVDRLLELESIEPLHFVIDAVRKTRAGLDPSLPLIGFSGAPFTLAAYAIEGGSSRDYRRTKSFMYGDTGAWDALMSRLARAATLYLNAQLDAGAQLVQLFDSWAGCLGPDDYRRYVLPHTRSVIESLKADAPVIHFATGNPALLPLLGEAFGKKRRPAVVGADWRIRLDDAWRAIGHDRAIQGNLDPVVLLSDPLEIRHRAKEIVRQAAGRPGHIFNLGHGVLPQTPVENAIALIDAVHESNGR
ncbi:MAG: uroporphyrinogen decarboxylase [Thermoguttaceae bacterium]